MANSKHEGKPAIIEYETYSGVLVHIKPVNIATLRAIQMKAIEKFPYPDKAEYQLPDENAFGGLGSAEDNPDYLNKCREIDSERGLWTDKTIFAYAVKFPKYATQQEMVNDFMSQLIELRGFGVLPEDDYEAVLHHLVLTWNQPVVRDNQLQAGNTEWARIIQMAIQTIPLTADEVSNGVRFFRPTLSGR
jgi:hypothetical protein